MTSSKFNRDSYNQWSSTYDENPNSTVAIDELYFPDFYKDWQNYRVLEIGCGTGRHTKRLFEQNNTIHALDVSEGMLLLAKKKLPEVKFTHNDFMDEKLEANSFEKILVSLVIEHIEDLDRFFQKIRLILKDNGEILISEIHPHRAQQGALATFKNKDGNKVKLASTYHSEREILNASFS